MPTWSKWLPLQQAQRMDLSRNISLIMALVMNAWRSFQLFQYGIVFQLALALIRNVDERMYYMDEITVPPTVNGGIIAELPLLPFQSDKSTLMEQLSSVKWPKRFKISHFNKNKHLIELCLTHSTSTMKWFS
jgi:hypothetical protein